MSTAPVALSPYTLEKLWGTPDTQPWWDSEGKQIGEVWFRENGEIPALLMKFIFTSEKLSVQVHPDDDYAGLHHNSPGKTEMWHILRATPGASVALGLKRELTQDELRKVSLSGEIEGLLDWIEVHPGDTIFVPAGTIHALGAGLVLCEIQQPSDVTYRLYDYGRPRELHLEHSLNVSFRGPSPALREPVAIGPFEKRLVACSKFVTDRLELAASLRIAPEREQFFMVVEGSGTFAGAPLHPGQAWKVPAGSRSFQIEPESRAVLLRTYVP